MVLPSTLILTVASVAAMVTSSPIKMERASLNPKRQPHSLLHTPNGSALDSQLSTLIPNAPTAVSFGGAHILLDNDVDTTTPKYPMILLSKARSYKDSRAACTLLGEGNHYLNSLASSQWD